MVEEKKKKGTKEKKKKEQEKKQFWGKLGDFVRDAVDCCIE